MKCAKCGHVRQTSDERDTPAWQCPSCGVAYAKAQQHQAEPEAAPPRPEFERANRVRSRWLATSVAAVLAIALLGVMLAVPRGGPDSEVARTPDASTTTLIDLEDSSGYGSSDMTARSSTPRVAAREMEASSLRQEIAAAEERLRATEAEISKYAGGLIKTLLESTAAIQGQTLEMLRQRDRSWTFGTGLRYTVDGRLFEPPADRAEVLARLEQEIARTTRSIAENEAEAAKYSGGLIQATTLAAAATGRQTLAMLEQRRVALQFGLPQYVGFQSGSATVEPTNSAPTVTPVATQQPAREWEIVEIDSRVTERNDTWWRYAWRLTLRNTGTSTRAFSATIEFQDRDGFVIDSDKARNLVVPGGEQRSFTGYKLVRVPGARSVDRTAAKVHEQ